MERMKQPFVKGLNLIVSNTFDYSLSFLSTLKEED